MSPQTCREFRLLMADVDGTLNDGGDELDPEVQCLIRRLEETGLMVGLVSGRTLSRLESMAGRLGIGGPIIAENGGLAKIKAGEPLLDLGHSRKPAEQALARLKKLYPGRIKEREDNLERQIDIVFWSLGPDLAELKKHIGDVQLLDSGYMCHMMQTGISKGNTLERLLGMLPYDGLNTDNVFAVGDSMTDITLFEKFPNSVFIPSPRLKPEEKAEISDIARFISDHSISEGFIEVARFIVDNRSC